MSPSLTKQLLLGRDRTLTRRYLIVAVGLFVGTLCLMGLVWALSQLTISISFDPFGALILWAVALTIVGLPAIQAFQNSGLLVSIALGVAMPLAFYLVFTSFDLAYPSEDLLWGIGTALQFGVPAGTIGFLFGQSLRHVHTWWTTNHSHGEFEE